jgi:hypothetical protein
VVPGLSVVSWRLRAPADVARGQPERRRRIAAGAKAAVLEPLASVLGPPGARRRSLEPTRRAGGLGGERPGLEWGRIVVVAVDESALPGSVEQVFGAGSLLKLTHLAFYPGVR